MTSTINTATTSERELTNEELDTVSGGGGSTPK
jgi:bacteriocin-like protein